MITPESVPGAIGPYSVGKMIVQDAGGKWGFSSGSLGMCANSGELVSDEVAS